LTFCELHPFRDGLEWPDFFCSFLAKSDKLSGFAQENSGNELREEYGIPFEW